mmetsp:Transcript_2976/g.6702  ORF Transcript_2976/g.6702 Transcript_2976/m.6702 type:complete len:102 (-) Transcript_2976:2761-3066(-)
MMINTTSLSSSVVDSNRQDEYTRDSAEKIMRTFRAFDPEGKGYIDGDYLKNVLMTRGDSFRPKEAHQMLAAAVEEASGTLQGTFITRISLRCLHKAVGPIV